MFTGHIESWDHGNDCVRSVKLWFFDCSLLCSVSCSHLDTIGVTYPPRNYVSAEI